MITIELFTVIFVGLAVAALVWLALHLNRILSRR